ncbi:MAG: hypothetical protein DRR06_02975 [Gammaproteobacteria bacterium]|nr:MAG: hypothetical protein DRR06_02975 [Gammaproteobacteria bacterium]
MIGKHQLKMKGFTSLFAIYLAIAIVFSTPVFSTPVYAEGLTPGNSAAGNVLLDAPAQFLPVEQAYQLIPSIDERNLLVDWFIAPGYYLYKHRFAINLYNPKNSDKPLALEYQPGKSIYDEYYDKELEVFYNATQISTTLPTNISSSLITLSITSQGCADAGLCYPPQTQYISVNLAKGTAELLDAPPAYAADSHTEPELSVPTYNSAPTYNIGVMLIFALVGGMILNLMPCVFPILSIKVMATTSAHLGDHNKHLHSIAYAAGIVLSFISIAAVMLILREAGQSVGWGFQLQSPTFVALLAYLLFVIAQSFSGQLNIGGGWMNLGQNLATGNRITSSFMTGVLATVVASPCTAPFMGTALGVALTQPAVISLAIFAALGLGMALPFLALSWIPGLMERLPAPGPWMNTFSQLLAFPLYASVIWLLWVLGRQTSIDHAIVVSLGILLLAIAIWLHRQTDNFIAKGAIIFILAGAVSLSLMPGPSDEKDIWQPYSAERLASLRAAGRPAFINLTADWCITCLANEKLALSSAAFKAALKVHNISYLKGDWTNNNPEITRLLNQHGRSGVPLYLYFDGAGNPVRILPQLLTESRVLAVFNGE